MKTQILISALILSGCSSYNLDPNNTFGIATEKIIDLQIADKNKERRQQSSASTDGQAVKSAIDRYQRSFENSVNTTSTTSTNNSNNSTIGSRQ